jgi:hypothetical protein
MRLQKNKYSKEGALSYVNHIFFIMGGEDISAKKLVH